MSTIPTKIKLLLVTLFWGIFSIGYFGRFAMPGFFSQIYLLCLALVVAAAAYGFGSLLTNQCLPASLTVAESILFALVSGFGLLGLAMVVAGVLGLWTHTAILGLVIIGVVLAWKNRKTVFALMEPNKSPQERLPGAPVFLIWAGAILSLLIAFTPVTYYDSLVYHFALPQAYIRAHHWIGLTPLIYSAFPQQMEMLWTLGMLLAGDVLANLLGWILAVLGVFAVYAFGKRFLDRTTALWAAALLSTMPAYVLLSSGGYVDVGLAVFSFTSFYALCLWKADQKPFLLVLAGLLSGFAVGTKLTGAISLAIGLLIILRFSRIRTLKAYVIHKSLYVLPALAVVSPWLIKNYHYVGNPVFPFCYSWTAKSLSPWLTGAAEGYFRGLTEYEPRSGWHLVKLLWDIAVHGLNFGGGMDVLGDLGWASLFAFLPAIWLAKKRSPTLTLVLIYAGLFFIPWGMMRPVLRFLLPIAPFLALAAAYGYVNGAGTQSTFFRTLGSVLMAFLIMSNARLLMEVSDVLSLFHVPLGFESRALYLSEKLDYFDAASFVNTLPETSLTYVVGDQRGYYYNKPVVVTPVFNTNPLTEWANNATSAKDLAARLQAEHITHLLINYSEMNRLDNAYHLFPFTTEGKAHWDELRANLAKPVYHDLHCDVLAL